MANQLDLLIKQVKDPYVRENFERLQQTIRELVLSGGTTNIFNNITEIEGVAVWEKTTNFVNGSSSKTIDTVALADFKAIKYVITFYNVANSATRSFEMNIVNENGTLKDSIKSKLGSSISYSINAVISGSDMTLQVSNNESYRIDATLAKLVL